MEVSAAKAPSAADLSEIEIKKEMKKDPLANKAPEKPLHEVPSGNSLLSSETILRTNKRGERRRRRCQVAFSYLPQNDDELELKVGDIIEVVGEVEEGWWEGVLNGKTGMFPSNFIKELSGESDELGISQDEQLSKSSLRETTGSESDGGDSSSTKSEGANGTVATAAIQPKKVKGVGFGDIFKDKPIKLRPRSIEVENDFLPVEKTIGKKLPATTATPDSSKTEMDSRTKSKDYCKVIFPYEAQNDDELTIKEGDIVTLINKDCIDVGWWEGELNGRRGVFPDNFVKLLPSDFEKEGNRPKKPPPPSAPVIKQGAGTTERKHEIKKIPPERPEMLPNRTEEKERPEREPKLDLQKPSVPAIPPKKPRPPKTNSLSRPGALPPRRPERPVGPLTHTRGDGPKIDLAGSSLSGILDKDLSDRSNDIDLEGFDSVVSSTEKLSHPTTSRPKATGRRPPSQSLTSSSLSSPDIFDSPSPEEDKEEHISLAHRGVDASKKTSKTVTISQVSDNKASLLPKPGTMAAGGGGPAPLSSAVPSPLSSSLGTAGHRANSPSLFGTEGKPKMEPAASSQAAVEELRTQVRELRSIIETMKDQQKREIKQLLSELDEEKKIRLRLQMEVNDIKKALQSK
ncbi:SH3 domain-containing kinase-binding protein 1 isoform X8 [Macaca thibetana thibetana]|uniref:SH3 domain containing kinase binding protein 1 n=3 Tax=Cercopithecinae TaxID=9528 RepID=A0A1D5QGU8_MACMU|nr:SH3 domain-containing kinase-binding protein 1 isoform X8 [Macaca mulatta]XP_003917527.1 SH3 domain-containing kinase-binding protein 1 isoform X10 [Papio anubis]XP_005593182.1 SH3 domain-containing kinase-binding protein 1 isoform X11 [Macaca fascicularis]XP_025228014.1 SH3 domain-containing kinase-binding protein 1 isoform X6 [Theropithecus gelada]XP_050632590.1 SH3 domain-containing kinase-binding protein 1 isoform X8 [Macaca thibetana thibetana]